MKYLKVYNIKDKKKTSFASLSTYTNEILKSIYLY